MARTKRGAGLGFVLTLWWPAQSERLGSTSHRLLCSQAEAKQPGLAFSCRIPKRNGQRWAPLGVCPEPDAVHVEGPNPTRLDAAWRFLMAPTRPGPAE